jgi:hypothetical protein
MEERKIDAYVPDSNLARMLNRGGRIKTRAVHPAQRRMRRKLREPAGRIIYARRKAIFEPVNGVLKEQRGMRRFRMRGLQKVCVEWALAESSHRLFSPHVKNCSIRASAAEESIQRRQPPRIPRGSPTVMCNHAF